MLGFLAERLRVQLRAEGARHDVLAAVFAAGADDDDLTRLLARTDAVAELLGTDDGANLLTGLSPRRQYPAHRGAQGRPARRPAGRGSAENRREERGLARSGRCG